MAYDMRAEFQVMQTIADAIDGLSQSERMRVLAWLEEYVASDVMPDLAESQEVVEHEVAFEDVAPAETVPLANKESYDTFEQLFAHVGPHTGAQKAVVAAWWLEKHDGQPTWVAAEITKLLKSNDIVVGSLSIVLANAVKAKNPLVEVLGRNGESARSRKTFKLTDAGVAYVEQRI